MTDPDVVMLVILSLIFVVLATVGILAVIGHRRDGRR